MRRAIGNWLGRHTPRLRRQIWDIRRRAMEAVGNDSRSRPSLHQIEDRLDSLFDGPGFFVEAGAFDGFDQSNTYWLERFRRWDGLLIEALPVEATRASDIRRAQVVHSAVGAPEQDGSTVTVHYAGLMSMVEEGGDVDRERIGRGLAVQNLPRTYTVDVPCRTLARLLDDANAPVEFDLLSLDVEGVEAQVLRGLGRYRPRCVLVEMNRPAEVDRVLAGMGYRCEDRNFTPNDALYVRT